MVWTDGKGMRAVRITKKYLETRQERFPSRPQECTRDVRALMGKISNPLSFTDPASVEATSLFRPRISLLFTINSLIPVSKFPVNFTGICGEGSRKPMARRELSG